MSADFKETLRRQLADAAERRDARRGLARAFATARRPVAHAPQIAVATLAVLGGVALAVALVPSGRRDDGAAARGARYVMVLAPDAESRLRAALGGDAPWRAVQPRLEIRVRAGAVTFVRTARGFVRTPACTDAGRYATAQRAGGVRFEPLGDGCAERRTILTAGTWRKAGP